MMQKLTNDMLLYHGSYCEVQVPDLKKCAKYKDFGQGFYLTSSRKQAEDICISLLLPERLQNQFCFKTDKALQCLTFVESEKVE